MIAVTAMGAVTFNVKVPDGTRACYIAASFNNWDAGNALEMTPSGENRFTLTVDNITTSDVANGFKYLCGRDWAYVEKGASGEELSDRTVATDLDEVASWAKLYNPDVKESTLTVNGYKRVVKVLLPTDYATSGNSYPVVYLTGVQARYNNAGSDSDRGDDHMGDASWNIPALMREVEGGVPCIFVSMYGFVAENIPYPYADFAGTGASDDFIAGIEKELMPYINSTYRTLTGASNTSIVGADKGGLLSVYAALKRPDLFGQCASISPTVWYNKNEILSCAATAAEATSQRFYFTVGSAEPAFMQADVEALSEAVAARSNTDVRFTTITNARHSDEVWGDALMMVYPYLLSADAPSTIAKVACSHADAQYSIVSAIDSQSLKYDANSPFVYVSDFVTSDGTKEAQVAITEIPTDVKTKYYWNVTRSADGTGEYLKAENGNIGFSSKKSATSWHRVVVFADETVKDIAANSTAFRVKTSTSEVKMTIGSDYCLSATVTFGDDKSFNIHYGSVNSGSDMGVIAGSYTVSADCTSANIIYNFRTNQVTITENNGGDDGDDDVIDIATAQYSLVSAIDSQDLKYDAKGSFSYITNYLSSGNEVRARVAVVEIPADVKSQYYWNVTRSADGTGTYLKAENGNIGFSSKKSATSWHRIAIFSDESVVDVAANSTAFRLVTSAESSVMNITSNYIVKASATFTGADKSFKVHYGSVNSGSDMGAITPTYNVSDNCVAATIQYNFITNQVSITETQWGEAVGQVVVDKFMAVPSVCNAGTNVDVYLEINDLQGNDVTVDMNHNYGSKSAMTLVNVAPGKWKMALPNAKAGIYHLSLNLKRGDNVMNEVKTIAVKVLSGSDTNRTLVVNAYEGIDWEKINSYKANFHTHTTTSFDANHRVDVSVEKYRNAGYKILALTDHDANPYPWEMFNLYNPEASSVYPQELDMLAIPGNELSKSYTNSWNEVNGSEFNHHNDFFTGRQGMEFGTLRESYAYTEKLGGMQLINHPGQYWSLDKSYTAGEKNSPEWHAENFKTYSSLIGLEVYNQGNRRANDRVLWDQILEITMPGRPVWGYSCDDSHNDDQLFRNYNHMLMDNLTIDELKEAMRNGTHYFSYEYTGSGEAKAPRINGIVVEGNVIKIHTDATEVYWISATDINGSPSTRKSSVVAVGKEFDFTGFQGNYVRALIVNEYGETCTQPFGFATAFDDVKDVIASETHVKLYPNPATSVAHVEATAPIESVVVYDVVGSCIAHYSGSASHKMTIDVEGYSKGHYVVVVTTAHAVHNAKLIVK